MSESNVPVFKSLPEECQSIVHKFSIAGHEGVLYVWLYPDTGMPGEIFITMVKQGSFESGIMDAFATAVSLGLQHGVPLDEYVNKFAHMKFEPGGFTNNRQIPIAKSIMDYIFRYLSLRFLSPVVREEVRHPCPHCQKLMYRMGEQYLCVNRGCPSHKEQAQTPLAPDLFGGMTIPYGALGTCFHAPRCKGVVVVRCPDGVLVCDTCGAIQPA